MPGDPEESAASALQVIVLGSGGGPVESNVAAFLVRSLSSGWRKGSMVAVDAGVHMSAITSILEATQPSGLGTTVSLPHTLTKGPFAGLQILHKSPAANAAHITRNLVDTYLITHPHLDHVSGFVINTAGLPGTRPTRLAGLPSTISAFKTHIFNNVIWPNLSDENNGAGLVTYMRLVEGGSPMGEEGYLEITDGLAVKTWSVSHGHCIERHSHHHRGGALSRYGSMDASSGAMSMSLSVASPRGLGMIPGLHRASSIGPFSQTFDGAGTPGSGYTGQSVCVYDSSAYFIRDVATSREVLIFGDVEPDSISLSPRNLRIWQEAAPKVALGKLSAIFIECSYDDSRTEDRLFGHLTPRFLIEELRALAIEVGACRRASQWHAQILANSGSQGSQARKKRKRGVADLDEIAIRRARHGSTGLGGEELPVSPKSHFTSQGPTSVSRPTSGGSLPRENDSRRGSGESSLLTPHIATPTGQLSLRDFDRGFDTNTLHVPGLPPRSGSVGPEEKILPRDILKGLKVVVIHVKDNMDDEYPATEIILEELLEHEKDVKLGCEFIMSSVGQSLMF